MRRFETVSTFEHLNPKLPKRQTEHSAGYDLSALEEIIIEPGDIKMIPTGIKVKLPNDEALFIYPRSSLGLKKHLMMSNSVGVIDADYYNNDNNEGHIMIPLLNFGKEAVTIAQGERVAQGVFMRFMKTTDDQATQGKRSGGFGSSGKH